MATFRGYGPTKSRNLAAPIHGGDHQRLGQHDGEIRHSANL